MYVMMAHNYASFIEYCFGDALKSSDGIEVGTYVVNWNDYKLGFIVRELHGTQLGINIYYH